MAHENGTAPATPFFDEIMQILYMRGDRQGAAPATALEGLQDMPLLPQFSSEWRNVPSRCGSTMQRYHGFRPDSVLPHDKVTHVVLSSSG